MCLAQFNYLYTDKMIFLQSLQKLYVCMTDMPPGVEYKVALEEYTQNSNIRSITSPLA